MKKQLLAALAISALAATAVYAGSTPGSGVLNSKHDMNAYSDHTAIRPDREGRVCAFCHTPHHALQLSGEYMPLWSHQLSDNTSYTQYDSQTYDAKNGSVDNLIGPTRLCMSCHDGTIAPDQHYGSANTGTKFEGNDFTPPAGQASIGIGMVTTTDAGGTTTKAASLATTHPIGFVLADAVAADMNSDAATGPLGSNAGLTGFKTGVAGGTAPYLGNPKGKLIGTQLYQGRYMTCATCHDVHNMDNATNAAAEDIAGHTPTFRGNYLVFSPQSGSQLCLSCHDK